MIINVFNTGGVTLKEPVVLQVTELIEFFCVFPEVYREQYDSLNIASFMYKLYRDPTCNLVERHSKELPLFLALEAYFSAVVLMQLKQKIQVNIGLDFDLPTHSFLIKKGQCSEFDRIPKVLLNYKEQLETFTYWKYFFNTLRRYKNEIRDKYCFTHS